MGVDFLREKRGFWFQFLSQFWAILGDILQSYLQMGIHGATKSGMLRTWKMYTLTENSGKLANGQNFKIAWNSNLRVSSSFYSIFSKGVKWITLDSWNNALVSLIFDVSSRSLNSQSFVFSIMISLKKDVNIKIHFGKINRRK